MATILESSASRRIRARRRQLVVDLFLRRGDFWTAIGRLRERWEVEPSVACPPAVERTALASRGDMLTYVPTTWPSRLRPSPLLPSMWPEPIGTPAADSLFDPQIPFERDLAWRHDIRYLHDLFVPAPARVEGGYPEAVWAAFFSACILYDPPPDQLSLYETTIPVVRFGPPQGEEIADTDAAVDSLAMEAPPIVSQRDDVAVWNAAMSYHHDIMAALRRTLRFVYGLDLAPILAQALASASELGGTPLERLCEVPFEHRIGVYEETTQDDVVNAFKMLRITFPSARGSNRATRDPLTCLQCAIWRDDFLWSYEKIGNIFGWTIQHPPGQKPRCENARLHVVAGRRIRSQEMAAA